MKRILNKSLEVESLNIKTKFCGLQNNNKREGNMGEGLGKNIEGVGLCFI